MADYRSPLHNKTGPAHLGVDGVTGIYLSERRLWSLWQIAGWGDFEPAAAELCQSLGLIGLGNYHETQRAGEASAWRIGPDKLLLENCGDLSAFAANNLMVLDLGHAKTVIQISGPDSRDLLSQLFAIDVAPAAFPPGQFLQTGIHHVGVLVQCVASGAGDGEKSQESDEKFEILVPGTWAESVWEVIVENALQFGVEVCGDE